MGVDIYPPSQPSGMALGYVEATADQTTITSEVDLTGLAVTVTVPAGRRIRVTGYTGSMSSTVASDVGRISIKEGATLLELANQSGLVTAFGHAVQAEWVGTPAAGTHTYKLTAQRLSGTGTLTVGAGATFPAYILVEDITGSIYPAGTLVTAGIIASEQWVDYVPTLTQLGTVAATINYSRYIKLGRMVTWTFRLTVTGTGTTNNRISLTLPFAAVGFANLQGTGSVYDNSTTTNYVCVVTSAAGAATAVTFETNGVSSDGWGVAPNLALTSPDVVRGTITYEATT
jgi:hypothetical protein